MTSLDLVSDGSNFHASWIEANDEGSYDVYYSLIPEPSTPTISIARNGSSMEVTWTGGSLESTTDLAAGPWTSVPDATSPHVFTAAEPQRFFRAVQP